MKFAELKKSLKEKILPAYLIVGNDDFLVNRSYELILDALHITMPDMNISPFNEDEVDFENVVKALNTLPFFEDKRLVYVNLINKNANVVKNIKALDEYFANINTQSVLVINCGSENKDYLKPYLQKIEVVDCNKLPRDLVFSFMNAEVKKHGKTFQSAGLQKLFDYTIGDLSKMNQELLKLVSFVGERSEITDEDVALICTKSVEFQIFELTNALAKKQGDKVFEILNILKAKKDEYRTIVGLIYNSFRRLLYVSITNEPNAKLAQMLGVQEYAIQKTKEQAKLFTKKALKEINDICMQIDYEIKNSNITVNNGVDYLVLKILNC